MSEQDQKETHSKESSSFSQIVEGAREVVHSAIEHAITHGAAHVVEHGGHALSKYLTSPYPGTPLLRPHSVWLWRSLPLLQKLEPLAKIVGSKAFAITTGVIKEDSDRDVDSVAERRMGEAMAREARIAEMRIPKVEQGIAYKNGSVYFPISRQWILPPIVLKPLHPKHSHPTHHNSSHSGHIPHPRASLHVDLEVVGSLKSLPTALRLSVHQPAHFRRNQILIKATPIFFDHGSTFSHDQRLEGLGNLVDLFLDACVYPAKPKTP
jgi:hypothetical protein